MIPAYPRLIGLLAKVGFPLPKRFIRAAFSEHAFRQNIRRSDRGRVAASKIGSGWGYATLNEDLKVAEFYKEEFETRDFSARETPFLVDRVIEEVSALLSEGYYKQVVNFGVCYGYLDSVLAHRFPDILFVGIDRAPAVKELNEKSFAEYPNMDFVAGDVLEWIRDQTDLSSTLLLSVRTLVLLPKDFVQALFQSLYAKSCTGILVFEPYGLSREINDLPLWGGDGKTVLFRDSMHLHDYGAISQEFDYACVKHEFLATGHVDQDYAIEVGHFELGITLP